MKDIIRIIGKIFLTIIFNFTIIIIIYYYDYNFNFIIFLVFYINITNIFI